MAIAYLQRNQEIFLNKERYKLVRLVNKCKWQLENINTGEILVKDVSDFHEELVNGNLEFITENGNKRFSKQKNGLAVDLLPKKERELVKSKYAYVKELEKNYIEGCDKKRIEEVIGKVWRKVGKPIKKPHWQTVYRWYRRYIDYGKDIRGLINFHFNKGNRIRRYCKGLLDIVDKSIDEIYLTRERRSIKDTLDRAIYLVKRENQFMPENSQLPLPTRSIVKSSIEKIPEYERCEKRYGLQYAKKKFRTVLNNVHADRVLERVEIDHTQLDLFVIDEITGLPLGRPWLTICIDVRSRCILGYCLGFEPPSYLTVAKCLKHAVLPKIYIAKDYPNIKNEWSCYGVFETLVVDNGLEFHGLSLESAANSLGINVLYTPRKTPWYKGIVERVIQTFNKSISHTVPGTTFSNIFEKKDYDPLKDAVVTLATLIEIVHIWIIDIYHQTPHRSIGCPPISIWKDEISENEVPLPVSTHEIDALIGAVATRVLTHKGIEINSLFYNSSELNEVRLKYGDKIEVSVRYDASDLGSIYVLEPEVGTAIKVPAIKQEYANKLTLFQHKKCKKYVEKYVPDRKDIEALAEAKNEIRKLIQNDFIKMKKKSRSRIARFSQNLKLFNENETEQNNIDHNPKIKSSVQEISKIEDIATPYSENSNGNNIKKLNSKLINRKSQR